MTRIPLENRLKKILHKKIAFAQDLLVETIYSSFPKAVIHGGTAIWRCYNGNRFSEDVDVYIPEKCNKKEVFDKFIESLKKKSFVVKKFKVTRKSVFSKFDLNGAEIRFEVVFKTSKKFLVKPFEMTDGTFINVYTLAPEEIMKEKILAYKSRRKVRDLYDVWFLSNSIEKKVDVDKKELENLEKPKDYETLKALLIFGALPTAEELIEGVKLWAKRNI